MNRLRSSQFLVLGAALLGLAAAIAALSWWLRGSLRTQALAREAAVYHAITTWQRALEQERLGTLGLPPDDQAFALLALEASRLPDVIGVDAFNLEGRAITSLAGPATGGGPSEADWLSLRRLEPIARLTPGDALTLEILVPLHEPDSREVTGALRYQVDSQSLRREFAATDRHLLHQALTIWSCSALTLALALSIVFRRLRRAEADVLARTADLEHANRELTFAAKTSALGALTAHLVHGLRNPAAGLASLADSDPAQPGDTAGLRDASLAARRIRQMIDEVVVLLRDEQSATRFEVDSSEVVTGVARDVAAYARQRQVHLTALGGGSTLDNRTAGLCSAILRNLTRNACEALPPGGHVTLGVTAGAQEIVFHVEDNGPGLPPQVVAHLFEPTASTKPDGAGLGLAISHQLAQHLGARLSHEPAKPHGTRFLLTLPR